MIRPARCGTSYARSLPATLRTPDTGGCDIRVKIDAIIEAMRHERYRFSPARRVFIPKKNGKLRPLGLPSWSDKLVGEVMRLLLEAYYEPTFSGRSHGFRPGRGCHTALREMQETWTGTTGVRLSTPEGCDLGFYGCGDAGVPTGSRLRIVITAGGRWWSRSVYRAGPVQRAPLGPPQGTAAAHGRPGTAI